MEFARVLATTLAAGHGLSRQQWVGLGSDRWPGGVGYDSLVPERSLLRIAEVQDSAAPVSV